MSDTNFPLSVDDGHDDLPRTFRRAREEKEREEAQREADAANTFPPADEIHHAPAPYGATAMHADDEGVAATVKRFDVPFLSLMMFFLKAVLAGIPALLLLGAIIWLAGEILQTYLPWLIKMQIFIHFPE